MPIYTITAQTTSAIEIKIAAENEEAAKEMAETEIEQRLVVDFPTLINDIEIMNVIRNND